MRPGTRLSFRPSLPTFWDQSASVHDDCGQRLARDDAPNRTPTATRPRRPLTSGLIQLNKYLSRAWYRAGISPQLHDDSSQAVYADIASEPGPAALDSLIADVGHSGIKDVFTRETSEGVAFFRAVDMVKKRAQRERIHQSLDSIDVAGPAGNKRQAASPRMALQEAIEQNAQPARSRVDPGYPDGQDPGRDRQPVGRCSQDGQQRKDPRPAEAPRLAWRATS